MNKGNTTMRKRIIILSAVILIGGTAMAHAANPKPKQNDEPIVTITHQPEHNQTTVETTPAAFIAPTLPVASSTTSAATTDSTSETPAPAPTTPTPSLQEQGNAYLQAQRSVRPAPTTQPATLQFDSNP